LYIFFISFLSLSYRNLFYLLSFPTRRSSDLVLIINIYMIIITDKFHQTIEETETVTTAFSDTHYVLLGRLFARIGMIFCCFDSRSEEHTSELQSRENHVCSLLLVKKIQKKN